MDLNSLLFLTGRVIVGVYFLYSAKSHFLNNAGLAGYAASKGVPFPRFFVYFAGLLLVIGGLGILLGVYIELALTALILFLLPVTFAMHRFWEEADPNMRAVNKVNFFKNLALTGFILLVASVSTPWPFSLMPW